MDGSRYVRGGLVLPLVLFAIGIYCIAFPEAILDDPAYARLPKRHFGAACGLLFIGGAIGFHCHEWWGRNGFVRVSHIGRTLSALLVIGAFVFIFTTIIDLYGWPR
jgi:hypothetical protein